MLVDVIVMHDIFWLEASQYPNLSHAKSMLAIYLIGQQMLKINFVRVGESTKQIIAFI